MGAHFFERGFERGNSNIDLIDDDGLKGTVSDDVDRRGQILARGRERGLVPGLLLSTDNRLVLEGGLDVLRRDGRERDIVEDLMDDMRLGLLEDAGLIDDDFFGRLDIRHFHRGHRRAISITHRGGSAGSRLRL